MKCDGDDGSCSYGNVQLEVVYVPASHCLQRDACHFLFGKLLSSHHSVFCIWHITKLLFRFTVCTATRDTLYCIICVTDFISHSTIPTE